MSRKLLRNRCWNNRLGIPGTPPSEGGTADDRIRTLFLNSIEALVFALEAKDKYTAGHSRG